ncbi:MAG: protein-methionine-sulfoxide reductase catalytic subunit MsrP [Myxococcota bacterium]
MRLRAKRAWDISSSLITPESVYSNRRQFIGALAGALAVGPNCASAEQQAADANARYESQMLGRFSDLFPAPLQDAYADGGRPLTAPDWATGFNNFYEFGTNKQRVQVEVADFQPTPWSVEVSGLVQRPLKLDLDDLMRIGLEERIYRHRCVEAWAMTVPWTGFPVKKLMDRASPLGSAKYVAFLSFNRPEQASGIRKQKWYRWPYYEALRVSEAAHPLAFFATGLYGKPLPKQNGAPIRLVVPWKYGYKSAKSITKIVFTEKKPNTFWVDLAPAEYTFLSNVNPDVPHPRWSQATEKLIGTDERVPTQLFNGYGEVASLYASADGR